jgi:anti-anti-sigma factor
MTMIETEIRAGVHVIKVLGRLTRPEAEGEFQRVTDQQLDAGARNLLIDLTETSFLDSSGVGKLVSILESSREAGGMMRLALVLDGNPHQLLQLASLDQLFEIHGDVESALTAFAG